MGERGERRALVRDLERGLFPATPKRHAGRPSNAEKAGEAEIEQQRDTEIRDQIARDLWVAPQTPAG